MSYPLVEQFVDALWLEKGLADNTLASYRSDLSHFAAWLDGEGTCTDEYFCSIEKSY